MSFTLKSCIQYLFKRNKMIDINSGTVTVESPKIIFHPLMEKDEFLKIASDFKVRSHSVEGVLYDNFTFRGILLRQEFSFVAYFRNNLITMISASIYDENEKSWSDITRESEAKKKFVHDKLLKGNIGTPPYEFHWGKITSDIEMRDFTAHIGIIYRSPN